LPLISFSSDETILGYDEGFLTQTLEKANIFFSTWMCVIVSVILVTSWFRASITTSDWVLLGVVSLALLGSSVVFFKENVTIFTEDGTVITVPKCAHPTDLIETSCKRVTLGFYLGLCSSVISFIMVPLYRLDPSWHLMASTALLITWSVGVAYITFSTGAGAA
jgi:hypothetical protein